MNNKPLVLIAEDEDTVREALKTLLEDEYQVAVAKDGQEALNLIKEKDFDLAILDIKMPKIDGISVLKQAKKLRPDLSVIMLTGYSSIQLAKDAVNAGADDYIVKPFDKEMLLNSIKKALGQ